MNHKKVFIVTLGATLSVPVHALPPTVSPVMMRLYGDYFDSGVTKEPSMGVPGDLDSSFGTNGKIDFTVTPYADFIEANSSYISAMLINQTTGWMYVAVDKGDGTNVTIEKMDADGNKVTSGFGTSGQLQLNKANAKYIGFDVLGRILVCGGDGSAAGWIARLSSAGVLDSSFGSSGYVAVPAGVVINQVAEQKSGRIIAAASDGKLYAFRADGLADTTFNPNDTTHNYFEVVASTNLQNLLITSSDEILVVYKDTTAKLKKIKADGSGFNTTYGTVDIGITPVDANHIYLSKDNDGKVYVAATVGTTTKTVKIARLASDSATTLDTYGSSGIATTATLTSGTFTLSALVVDASDKTIIAGFDDSSPSVTALARFTSGGSADTSFSSDGLYTLAGATNNTGGLDASYTAAVHPDGSVFVGGDDQYSSYSHPAMIRVFGDIYDPQYHVPYTTGSAGAIDTTFGTSGSLNLTSTYSLTGYGAKKIHMFADGSSLIAFDNTTSTVKLAKLKPDMTLDTSFGDGGSGILTMTSVTVSDSSSVTPASVSDLFVTRTGDIYVSGVTDASKGFVVKISSAGVVDSTFKLAAAVGTAFTNIAKVQQSKDTKLMVVGTASSDVLFYSLNSSTGAVDTTFQSGNGYLSLASTTGFMDATVDQYDRVYVLFKSGSNLTLRCYLPYGSTSGTASSMLASVTTGATGRLVVDTTNNRVIIAAVNGTSQFVVRAIGYSSSSADFTTTDLEETVGSSIADIADLLVDTQENIYVVGYNSSNAIVVARLTDTAGTVDVDTSYGSSGVAVITPTGMTRATAGAIHPDRRVVVVGSNTAGTTAYMTRLFGDAYNTERTEELVMASHGSLDTVLDSANNDGFLEDSGLSSSAVKRILYLNNSYKLIEASDTGSATVLKVVDLDGAFTSGLNNLPTGVSSLFASTYYSSAVDQTVLVAGNNSGTPWLRRVTSAGASDSSFNSGATLSLTNTDITTVNAAVEQKGGRILAAGYISGNGVVVGYKGNGTGTDVRFGQVAVTESNAYRTGVDAAVQAMVVDASDYIYIAYIDSGTVKLEKIMPDGSAKVSGFGSSGVVTTGMTSATGTVQMALSADSSKLIVSCVDAGVIKRASYLVNDGTISTAVASLGAFTNINTPVLTDMQTLSNDKVVLVGYDSADNSHTFIARLTSALELDTNFAATTATATDGAGYYTPSATVAGQPDYLYGVAVQADGKVVAAGKSYTNDKPVIMRVFSDAFVTGIADGIGQQTAGAQDTTADVGSALDISVSDTYASARLVHAYTNGKLLVVLQDGTNSYIKRFLKDMTADTSFGSSGVVTISNKIASSKLIVDESGNIYVTGTDDSLGWLYACDSSGTAVTGFGSGPVTGLLTSNAIARQKINRTVIAGSDGSGGALYAYTNAIAVDSTFAGGDGLYQTGVATPISDMFVDSNDRIMIAYRSGSDVVLKRLLPNGVSLDTTFGTGGTKTLTSETVSSSSYNTQIKLHQFGDGTFAVAYKYSATQVRIKKLELDGSGSNTVTVTVDDSAVVTGVQADSAGRLVVIGNDVDASYPFIIRTNSTLSAVDSSFGTSGYLIFSTGALRSAYGVTILPDRRYVLVGTDAAGDTAYMARVYGDSYNTVPTQNPSLAAIGSVDTSLSLAADVNYVSISTLASLTGATPKGIVAYNNTTLYVLLAGATDSYIAALNVDGVLDSTFNSTGVLTISGKDSANSVILTADSTPKILVAGKLSASSTAWARVYNVDGTQDTSVFSSSNDTANVTAFNNITRLANIVQQATVRTILGGKDSTGVVLVGIDNAGALDASFGSSGRYTNNTLTNGLSHFVLDQKNRIIGAYLEGSAIKVMRLNKHGRSLDTTFNSTGIISTSQNASATGAKLTTDASYNTYVALANTTGDIVVKRYSEDGSTVATGTLAVGTTSFAAPVVTQVIVTQAGKVYVLGYDDNGSSDVMFVVRFNSSLGLDTTFDTDGYVTFSKTGSSATTRQIGAGVVLANGRLVVVGHEA